jgi:hypothetical protein
MSSCPKGKIRRTAYEYDKKSGSHVKVGSTCVVDKGKPGKGPKLFVMPKYDIGILSDYGYSLRNSHDVRVESIEKSLKDHSKLKLLRHINALRTLQKSNKTMYNKLTKDLHWIQKHYDKL